MGTDVNLILDYNMSTIVAGTMTPLSEIYIQEIRLTQTPIADWDTNQLLFAMKLLPYVDSCLINEMLPLLKVNCTVQDSVNASLVFDETESLVHQHYQTIEELNIQLMFTNGEKLEFNQTYPSATSRPRHP